MIVAGLGTVVSVATVDSAQAASPNSPTAIGVTSDGVSYVGFASGGKLMKLSPSGARKGSIPLDQDEAVDGLAVEPGRNVVEVRSPDTDKGVAVRRLAEETGAGGFVFVGDDLGDVAAFEAVRGLREGGMPTLLACSASPEESALVDLADVVVPGPDGVLELLRRLTSDADLPSDM